MPLNSMNSLLCALLLCLPSLVWAQDYEPEDSLHFSIEKSLPPKVLHAEPLYIDLIRDLGARKGEREWNFGAASVDRLRFDRYEALVEYEWAPIDRLGLEIELPVTIFSAVTSDLDSIKPSNRLESIKMAAQWSFFVSQKYRTSLAIGYINEFEIVDLDKIGTTAFFTGNVFNPFLVAAKRFGRNWHSLIYTGPQLTYHFNNGSWDRQYELHTNIHYMIPDSRNFVGLEINSYFHNSGSLVTLRPQMRLSINEQLLVGIVTGIPLNNRQEGLSTFVRLIYEPPHRIKNAQAHRAKKR